ncbi:hypothetical protein J2Z83_003471 [Virgibacillus natechei]|uniref:Uncharacterized protein n=1 Tax=Virgibacillus natechei TaxID=1216297 RepID=A0ABS4IK32_9BACI|nr:hypothetical protein [Virgibacillus natechei]MBP1971332.1 hypothetical protein [Virgibacillus natechei]UZD12933.1 hypothetical protein OLD84_18955 [Virgibacillus natechei]
MEKLVLELKDEEPFYWLAMTVSLSSVQQIIVMIYKKKESNKFIKMNIWRKET